MNKKEIKQAIEVMDSEEFIKLFNEYMEKLSEYFGFENNQKWLINPMYKFNPIMKNWEPLDIAYAIAKGASYVGTCDIADAKYFFIHNSAIYTFKTLTAKTMKKHVSDMVNHVLEGNDLGSKKLNAIIELNKVC